MKECQALHIQEVTHSFVDGPSVGGLHEHLVSSCSDLLDVSWSQRRASLPHVDILAADGYDTLVILLVKMVMLKPPLTAHTAPKPSALAPHETQHDCTSFQNTQVTTTTHI